MRTEDLTGAELDYWCAKAEGHMPLKEGEHWFVGLDKNAAYSPSTDWAQGGPIIEREHHYLEWDEDGYWCAHTPDTGTMYGETPLLAAMRAYVASKFGLEVGTA